MADKYKTTWMLPRSKHWHIINSITDTWVTCAMRGVECWSDHRLVRSQTNLYILPPHRIWPKTARVSYKTSKLKNPFHPEDYQCLLDEKFLDGSITSGDNIEKWSTFKDAITAVAKEVLRPKARIHQDRFDKNTESIQAALETKNTSFTEGQNDPTSVTKKTKFKKLQTSVQSELWERQDQWWQDKAEEVQRYTDSS